MRFTSGILNLIFFILVTHICVGQTCGDWLHLPSTPSFAEAGEIDVPGNKITVEALFNRTEPYYGGAVWAGDLVSKHKDPIDVNYLLRPNNAEITTSNGYFSTPEICEIELNRTYHVAMVYDGTTLKFYRNGFLLSEIAASGNLYQNDWATRIGFYEPQIHPENFLGYIDEVRIWNVARTQEQIRASMASTLPSPSTQAGLVAYYTFEDLINKQGNTAYNLVLSRDAKIESNNPQCTLVVDSCDVLPVPDSVILNNDTTICINTAVKLRTQPAIQYQWSPSVFLDNPNSSSPVAKPQSSITYYVEATMASGEIVKDSVKITVITPFIQAFKDTTICYGGSAQLNSSVAHKYEWKPAAGLSNATIRNPTASPLQSTRYILTGIDNFGCEANDTVIVTVHARPNISVSNDTTVCQNTSMQLSATGGSTYLWTPSTGISNQESPTTVAYVQQSTSYRVEIQDQNNCTFIDSVQVTVSPYPTFGVTGITEICHGDSVVLQASGGDLYKWTASATIPFEGSAEMISRPISNTTYTVDITETTCSYDTSITRVVTVNPAPTVEISGPNTITCQVPYAKLNARGAQSYEWFPAASVDNPFSQSTIVSIDTTMLITVTGTNESGCSSSTSIEVIVEKGGNANFVLPDAFTPNNDGRNDCFGVRTWGNSRIRQFTIYNRWGQVVFETNDPSACWDGTFNGVKQQSAGYVYVIDADTFCGPVRRRGIVTLIR